MIRSNRSIHRVGVLLVAMFALAIVAPAGAFAQSIEPTDEEYGNGVVALAAEGDSGDPSNTSDPVDPTATSSGISELPFTGLDVAAIAAIGAGLVGAGFMVRRASRSADDSL